VVVTENRRTVENSATKTPCLTACHIGHSPSYQDGMISFASVMPFHCGDLFAKAESTRQPYNPARSRLEIKPHAQLNFTLRQCRSEPQRCARRNCASVPENPSRSDPVHVERREAAAAHIRWQPKEGAH